MYSNSNATNDFPAAIAQSGFDIYTEIEIGNHQLWIPLNDLQILLDKGLRGLDLSGLPIRTRSKVVKEQVCRVLGYPVPKSFKKTQPRFPGQSFDVYIQKSNNLQIWNEEISKDRRYVIIHVTGSDSVDTVRVINGNELEKLDKTGTLTQKYQARCIPSDKFYELIAEKDTDLIAPHVREDLATYSTISPVQDPESGYLYSIQAIFSNLKELLGKTFEDAGVDQERNRGAALHRLVCQALGYSDYQDDGKFPDIRHQLLEVKLQTSPTVDLGLVCPDSDSCQGVPKIGNDNIRHRDVRYVIFYGITDGITVTLTHLFLTTGADFFQRFPQFQGKVVNKKLQIPLPKNFFID